MPRHRAILVAALLPTLAALPAVAEVPAYVAVELCARSNSSGAYNLPDGAFFTSVTPRLTDARHVAFRLITLPGPDDVKGVWFGGPGAGSVVYTGPSGAFLSGVTVDTPGRIVFELTYTSPAGLYYYDTVSTQSGIETNLPIGASGWGSPEINAMGEIGYRASFSGDYAWVSYDGVSSTATHVADASLDLQSPYSYLFTPSFNADREIAGKLRLGAAGQVGESQPDQIRVFASDGSSVLIAEDQDSDPGSLYTRFDNSVSLTDTGWVAFVAEIASGARVVVLSDGTTTVDIASEEMAGLSEVEFFGASASSSGLVAFRGVDDSGLQAIFVGDGSELVRLIGEHDLVTTDLGIGRIDQHDSSVVFGGSPSINAAGDVAFNAALTPADDNQVEWGSGIFVARTEIALFADGFESGDTAAWAASVP